MTLGNKVLAALLIWLALFNVDLLADAQTGPIGSSGGGSSGLFPGTFLATRFCIDTANQDTGLSRVSAGLLKVDDCASTAKDLLAKRFTTSGTMAASFALSLASTEIIGIPAGPDARITFSTPAVDVDAVAVAGPNFTSTSGGSALFKTAGNFVPASGSGSFASAEIKPTCNGTSSGTCYGLGIASVTNVFTGGTIKLFSVGTTTTDLFTGYSPVFAIATNGAANFTGVLFANLATPANGTVQFCTDCDAPTLVDSTCTSAGAKVGALAVRVNNAWKCIS